MFFHFTPTSSSWQNLVEAFFGIFTPKALKGANFKDRDSLVKAIKVFMEVYNEGVEPFVRRKRKVKGSQLKNSLKNFRNLTLEFRAWSLSSAS
jgi:hypothetical protein